MNQKKLHISLIIVLYILSVLNNNLLAQRQPNILFVISDDQSFPYASAYGTRGVKTPGFDKVAESGILFTNAFVTSPGCSPSRASMLTGRYPWQIEEAGTHASSFPLKYKTFTQVLEENGYAVGYTGKPWGPGDWQVSGWKQNPVGKEYNQKKLDPPFSGISKTDYAGNFDLFLEQRKPGQPFFFWMGGQEPHRVFEEGSGIKAGKSDNEVRVPGFMPANSIVKNDLLDYFVEIEWFDSHLQKALQKLDALGELENTIVVVTSDNGMPFPRAKANVYDAGIHVPLAICWGGRIHGKQKIHAPVSTIDLAPTFLEAAGLTFNGQFPMSGQSFLRLLVAGNAKAWDLEKKEVYAGRERHSSSRFENRGYPQRAIRTAKYLYILNYHPEYWPAGDPQVLLKDGQPGPNHGAYMDIDDGPTLQFYKKTNVTDPAFVPLFQASMAKRPAEELYDLQKDPYCMVNLAGKKEYEAIRKRLSEQLSTRLKADGDPRENGPNPEVWETYPRLKGDIRNFPATGN